MRFSHDLHGSLSIRFKYSTRTQDFPKPQLILTLFLLALFLASYSTNAQSFTKRLNCGSTTDEDYLGETYEDDETASGVTFTSGSLKNTFNISVPEALKSVRYIKNADRELIYSITVPQAGDYTVNLYFAEPHWGINSSNAPNDGVGVRIFDVIVQGATIPNGEDVDVFDRVGAGVLTLSHTATVTSSDNNILTLEFDAEPGKNDPIINAIEIISIDSDTTDPTAPSNFQTTSLDHNSIHFGWDPSTDANGIVNYVVENSTNGTSETISGTTASYQATGLNPNTTYNFQVKAIDPSGNESAYGAYSNTTGIDPNNPGAYDPDLALRINAGGAATTFDNKQFLADQYFVAGSLYTNSATGLGEPYVTERFGSPGTLSYNIPLANGSYRVILHFAELYYGATGGSSSGGIGDRVFDVNIENDLKIDNYDIYADVGAQTPVTKTFDLEINDQSLSIYLSALTVDGGVGDPKISAIEVLGTNQFGSGPPPSGGGYWTKSDTTDDIFYNVGNGNVGIGTSDPGTYKLAVDGTIHTKEVRVDLLNWADYVFAEGYNLPTLKEVEAHIREKGRLINMPSASEVGAEGILLGEMNRLLLEKIEELTLYILEMKKELQELRQ